MYDQSSEPFLSGFLHLFFFSTSLKQTINFAHDVVVFSRQQSKIRGNVQRQLLRETPGGGGEGALIYFTNKVNNLQTKLLYNFLGS